MFPVFLRIKLLESKIDDFLSMFTLMQVVLNQIILGPSVIAVVFAWNNLWQGKLSELPNKYQKDALRTLLFGNSSICTLYILRIISICFDPMPIKFQLRFLQDLDSGFLLALLISGIFLSLFLLYYATKH